MLLVPYPRLYTTVNDIEATGNLVCITKGVYRKIPEITKNHAVKIENSYKSVSNQICELYCGVIFQFFATISFNFIWVLGDVNGHKVLYLPKI